MPPSELETMLAEAVSQGASDLHLISGSPPILRITGQIVTTSQPVLDSAKIWAMTSSHLNERQQKSFQDDFRVNISFTTPAGRFRMNLCMAVGSVAASIRAIPSKIYPLSALGLPPIVGRMTQ